MNCHIDINGSLIIEAETETEAFAMERWAKDFRNGCTLSLIIKPSGAGWDSVENNVVIFGEGS